MGQTCPVNVLTRGQREATMPRRLVPAVSWAGRDRSGAGWTCKQLASVLGSG